MLVATLKKIINQAWELDSFDGVRLAKYMRCLFQVALSENPHVAESLLSQIEHLAKEASDVSYQLFLVIFTDHTSTDPTAIS